MTDALDLSLYICVGPTHCPPSQIVEVARQAVAGGATLVQLRDKTSPTREMIDTARALVDVLRPSGVPLLINDRVDVAMASAAAGVHVGQQDISVEDARRLLGPSAIIGLTVKNEQQARNAPVDLLDYVSFGGVFETTSKQNPDPPIGIAGVAALTRIIRGRCSLPLCAIAGINAGNATGVIQAGTDGVCVVSAITQAPDPEAAARAVAAVVTDARVSGGNGR